MDKKIAVFVTANEAYAFQAAVALQSVRRFFPDLHYFVIGDFDRNSETAGKLEKLQIGYLRDDWATTLEELTSYRPLVAYSMLSAPELLGEQGFTACLGLDADVICVRNFDLYAVLEQTRSFAGIANQQDIKSNWFHDPKISNELISFFGGNGALDGQTNPNTGVVFFSCQWAQQFGLRKACEEILRQFGHSLVPGDQACFAATIFAKGIDYHVLGHEFNLRLANRDDEALLTDLEFPVFVHFTGPKPWSKKRIRWWPLQLRKPRVHWARHWRKNAAEISILW